MEEDSLLVVVEGIQKREGILLVVVEGIQKEDNLLVVGEDSLVVEHTRDIFAQSMYACKGAEGGL